MILKNGEKVNIFVSHDNSKTGIDSFNLLAGDREGEYTGYKNRELFDELKKKYGCTICGTCSGNCPGCYAKKMTRFPDVLRHDNGLDLYDMDKIKNKLVDISGDIIKDLMIETTESRELYLYADNNDEIFCRWLRPIIDNYKRKYKKGIYNHSKAIKGLLPALREAAKLYYKEFCSTDFRFDNETIFAAAVAMEADIYDCYVTYEG